MSNLTSVDNSKSELKNNSAAELSHAEVIPNQAELIFSSGDKSPSRRNVPGPGNEQRIGGLQSGVYVQPRAIYYHAAKVWPPIQSEQFAATITLPWGQAEIVISITIWHL